MSGIMNMFVATKTTIATAVDAFFNSVSLLLNTSSTNGAQNNTFLDSSTNNFTITRNGNTTQGTFTPFSQTGWGNYFGGSSDWLSISDNAAFTLGTGDFTVEYWIYWTNSGVVRTYGQVDSAGLPTSISIVGGTDASNKVINRAFSSSTDYLCTSTASLATNTWTHIAFVRNGTTLRQYINGVQDGTVSISTASINDSTNQFSIGRAGEAAANYFGGYISNFRLVKGTCLYPSGTTFTPSTTPLTAITNTSLLTCQSNRFLDTSTNAFAITVNGTPSVQAFSPFLPTAAYDTAVVGGSGYFDGSGDYLTGPNASGGDFSTGSFTISAWFYPTTLTGGTDYGIMSYADTGGWNGWQLLARATTKDIKFEFLTGSAGASTITGGTIVLNAWNYVAIVRSGSTVSMYVNSTTAATSTTNSTAYGVAGSRVIVGADRLASGAFVGYISNAKLVKQANAPASIPTAPDTNTTNTSFLLNYTNAGIYDSASKNVLETVGNAQVSTTQAKWGTTSIFLDGTGDWLTIRDSELLEFGSGDFTIETWVYPTLITGDERVLLGHGSGSTNWFSLYITSSATVEFAYILSNSAVIDVTTTSTVSLNTWTHIALVRNGTSFKIYINGTDGGSSSSPTTTSSAISNFSDDFRIGGARWNGGSDVFQGYMDDFRISKYARYTANFTAPTAAFSLQ